MMVNKYSFNSVKDSDNQLTKDVHLFVFDYSAKV